MGITKFEHNPNEEIRGETEQCTVGELVTRSRLRWLGHVVRMDDKRLPPQLLFGKIEGKGKAGRPVGRWKDMIEADLKRRGVQGWYRVVQNRVEWRKVVHGEGVVVARRGKKKETEAKVEEVVANLSCPKCGTGYQSNKGGWFVKHVDNCAGKGVVREPPKVVEVEKRLDVDNGGGGLKCPKCGKGYRSNAGGWFKKHIDKCGPSQSHSV